jgi:hypothetical protein
VDGGSLIYAVIPVERVLNPVGLLVVEADLAGAGLEGALSAIAACPDESRRQVHHREMILTGHRIFERRASAFADAVDAEGALHAGAFDGDGLLLEADHLHRRPEQFPRQPAERA